MNIVYLKCVLRIRTTKIMKLDILKDIPNMCMHTHRYIKTCIYIFTQTKHDRKRKNSSRQLETTINIKYIIKRTHTQFFCQK